MALPLFRLIQLHGLVFIVTGLAIVVFPHLLGQSAFFLGASIPLPLPHVPAPFRSFMTQKGLEEQWPTIMNACRALGGLTLLFGVALLGLGSRLMEQFHAQMEYLAKRGKRGEAVHSKVERYETQIGATRVQYIPPPLWLLVLLHAALAAVAHYVCAHKLLGPNLEVTQWSANLVAALHAIMAVGTFACWMQARSLWKADSKAAAPKAE